MASQASMALSYLSELEVSCNFLEFLLRFPTAVSHLSYSNGSRSPSPQICPHTHTTHASVPRALGGKIKFCLCSWEMSALPRPVPVQCPHRLQCSEKPTAEALGSDLFPWLCSPSLLITPSVDTVVGVAESQPWPEVVAINKMPFMKLFLPGSFNEECFA